MKNVCCKTNIIIRWTLLSIPHLKYKQKQMKKCRIRTFELRKFLKKLDLISYKSFYEEYFVKKEY